jgi:hypothetical protein
MPTAAGNSSAAVAPWSARNVMIHAPAMLPVGVKPQQADVAAKPITPIVTTRLRPATSASLPPNANSADSASRYPLMIHCDPVAVSDRSFCRFGIAIATIV